MKIELTKDEKETAVGKIRTYFATERGENIGELQGLLILDFFLESLGPIVYNRAVGDMQQFLHEKADDMYEKMVPEKK